MSDIDPSEMPGAIVDEQTPAQNVEVTDLDPQSAQASLGLRQESSDATNGDERQYTAGGSVNQPASFNTMEYYPTGGVVGDAPNPTPTGRNEPQTETSDIPGAI